MIEGSDDLAGMTPSEATDQDELRVDPLEAGAEPPEHWSEADRFGMTHAEQEEGEPLDDRLRQERPDTQPEDVDDASQLGDNEVIQGRVEELPPLQDPPVDNADRADGSVTESLREPGPS